ncbi:MAG: hypothetical protein RLZZ126_1734 [Pseudomonadota bacterium]|jgi:branched-chain amino acid transport system substrate-binding protein
MKLKLFAAALALVGGGAVAQQQGVSRNEILLGTIQDLSGPLAAYGKQARNGMQLRIDEVNEQGGIHGRKLKLATEDSGYDPKRAVLAAQKLVTQDKIFIMAGHVGTAHNNAAMPVQFEKNIINFLPISPSSSMFEPFHRLKYSFAVTYEQQVLSGLPKMVKEKNAKRVCTLYQDDEFGLEVLKGADTALKGLSMALVEKTSYKRGATDFSSQVARMKAANCDLVLLATIVRETIGTIAEARKIGFNPTFFSVNTAYTELIHKLGGKAMDGLYSTMTVQHPYLDEASPQIRFWANKYKTKYNEDPGTLSVYGYQIVDLFVQAAAKAGPTLTTDSFIKAMDSIKVASDMFGASEMSFGPNKRLGTNQSRISQIQDGRWKVVMDYAKP